MASVFICLMTKDGNSFIILVIYYCIYYQNVKCSQSNIPFVQKYLGVIFLLMIFICFSQNQPIHVQSLTDCSIGKSRNQFYVYYNHNGDYTPNNILSVQICLEINIGLSICILNLFVLHCVYTAMSCHTYKVADNIYQQIAGGSIGLELTGAVSRPFMLKWDQLYKDSLR